MTSGREDSPLLGFSILTPLPGPNVGELPPITASTFTTRSPDNMPLVHRASTSANLDPVISPAFVETNYEVLESLLRDRRRQVHNEDLRTKLDYYSEEYDEEMEMEPRLAHALNRDMSMVKREFDSRRRSERRVEEGRSRGSALTNLGGNLPPNGTYISHNAPPFIPKDYPLPDRLKIPSYVGSYDGKGDPDNYLHLFEEHRISGFVHGLSTKSLVEFLSKDLPTTYKGLMEKTYTWIEAKEVSTNRAPNDHKEGFDKFNKGFSWHNNKGRKKNWIDHGHETNQCRELRHQIEEAVKSGQLAHLVKCIKKGKAKSSNTQLGFDNSSDLVIIRVQISRRQVNRVYMDSGSSCEVIYEHCFLKLKPSIRSFRVDSKIPLVRFLGEHSWPLGVVPLEVTMGESPYIRT
ncbi:hypothetical protein Tco_0777705 [Tanacetum coccineum]